MKAWIALGLALWATPGLAAEPCGTRLDVSGPQDAALRRFAAAEHLRFPDVFVHVVGWLRRTGRLPECYVDKRRADAEHWRPGDDLWAVDPGGAVGGDRFANAEGRLPAAGSGHYVEADLDYAGGHRGAARLIVRIEDGRAGPMWVTVDHYRSFQAVPPP